MLSGRSQTMVARFQARNNNNNSYISDSEVFAQTGIVDSLILPLLKRDWELYATAVDNNPSPIIDKIDKTWITQAIDIWEKGITGAHVVPSYTQKKHADLMNRLSLPQLTYTREGLLTAWISQESPYHWGTNRAKTDRRIGKQVPYQRTDYRMTMGGDQHGSLSFSQLVYANRFGTRSACAAHSAANLNLYDPLDQVKTFVIHGAAEKTNIQNCQGGMNLAFIKNSRLGVAYELTPAARDVSDLVGIKGIKNAVPGNEDDYEKLAKAINVYNSGGQAWIIKVSMPYALKYFKHNGANGTNNQGSDNCFSCKYSIEVRERWLGGNNLRTYIWAGARDATGTVLWCFAFGEKEWVGGKTFIKINNAAKNKNSLGQKQTPVGRVNCITGAGVVIP